MFLLMQLSGIRRGYVRTIPFDKLVVFTLGLKRMVLEKNGDIVTTGAGAAALGSPANSVAWLANALGKRGVALEAGEVILSGSLAIMVPCQAGDSLRVTIGGIGGCSVRFI
jgi:2-oxopent-4-enoate/cis-2-oxohex-4-enoate hydratase